MLNIFTKEEGSGTSIEWPPDDYECRRVVSLTHHSLPRWQNMTRMEAWPSNEMEIERVMNHPEEEDQRVDFSSLKPE